MGLRSHLRSAALVSGGALLTAMLFFSATPAGASTPTCFDKKATIVGDGGTITGTNGPDVIVGTGNGEAIYGLGGNDLICGLGGNDYIDGGADADKIDGGGGSDVIVGGGASDDLYGGSSNDSLSGGSGTDRGDGGGGSDLCDVEAPTNCEHSGDTGITISINDARGDGYNGSFAVDAVFTVTLSAPSNQPVSVHYTTVPGTATEGDDYGDATGVLVFAPGQTEATIVVDVRDNSIACEPDETFYVNLSDPVGATIADGQGLGTIDDTYDCGG